MAKLNYVMQKNGKEPVKLDIKKVTRNSIVDVRPNKQEISEGAMASGVVYKVTEEELVLVLNEPPSGDLDQPLQLELLANEVAFKQDLLKRIPAQMMSLLVGARWRLQLHRFHSHLSSNYKSGNLSYTSFTCRPVSCSH